MMDDVSATVKSRMSKAIDAHASYRIVCSPGSESRPQVARFIEWVLSETANFQKWSEKIEFLARS